MNASEQSPNQSPLEVFRGKMSEVTDFKEYFKTFLKNGIPAILNSVPAAAATIPDRDGYILFEVGRTFNQLLQNRKKQNIPNHSRKFIGELNELLSKDFHRGIPYENERLLATECMKTEIMNLSDLGKRT